MVEGTAVLFGGIESAAETPGEKSPFERLLLRELAAAAKCQADFWVIPRSRRIFIDETPLSDVVSR